MRKESHEWAFKGEMASAFWRRLDVIHIVLNSAFSTPNWFEQVLHYYSKAYREMFVDVDKNKRFRVLNAIVGPGPPIVLHVDTNSAKTVGGVDIDASGRSRNKNYHNDISTASLNRKFLEGQQSNFDVLNCDIQHTVCPWANAVFVEPFGKADKQRQMMCMEDDDVGFRSVEEKETYLQNAFKVEYESLG